MEAAVGVQPQARVAGAAGGQQGTFGGVVGGGEAAVGKRAVR